MIVAAGIFKPSQTKGSFGDPLTSKWRYYCQEAGCTWSTTVDERIPKERYPRCEGGHGRVTGEQELDQKG